MPLRRALASLPLALLLTACGHTTRTSAVSAHSQPQPVVQPAPQEQPQARPTSTPYTGDLSIFDKPGREQRLQIDRVMDLLHITPGRNVADLGAGSGWFSVQAAQRVGPGGIVYAEDINPESTRYIDDRAASAHLFNIRPILGKPDDPRLPEDSVNAVLMLKMYHEIARPVEFLEHLRPALRPGALIGIIDRNGNGSGTDHGIREETIVHEMESAGFHETGRYDFVKPDGEDYFLIFQEKSAPQPEPSKPQ